MDELGKALAEVVRQGAPIAALAVWLYFTVKVVGYLTFIVFILVVVRFGYFLARFISRNVIIGRLANRNMRDLAPPELRVILDEYVDALRGTGRFTGTRPPGAEVAG